jgi:hypothetical protein
MNLFYEWMKIGFQTYHQITSPILLIVSACRQIVINKGKKKKKKLQA